MNCADLKIFDRLVSLLEDWGEWQKNYFPKTGYPSSSAGFGYGSGIHSFEDMCASCDDVVMVIVDTAIDGLLPAQSAAICRRYGQANVYRFPRNNYEEMLLSAHEALIVALPSKGVVL